jgi:hypothetical protein
VELFDIRMLGLDVRPEFKKAGMASTTIETAGLSTPRLRREASAE